MTLERHSIIASVSGAAAWVLRLPIHLYRLTLSPYIGWHCRFQPTCSVYALEALEKHGPIRGLWLTVRRIGRCHPFGGFGYDPVPDPSPTRSRKLG